MACNAQKVCKAHTGHEALHGELTGAISFRWLKGNKAQPLLSIVVNRVQHLPEDYLDSILGEVGMDHVIVHATQGHIYLDAAYVLLPAAHRQGDEAVGASVVWTIRWSAQLQAAEIICKGKACASCTHW